MKQYRITTENLPQSSPNDCELSPDDPIHELIAAQTFGGLGSHERLNLLKINHNKDISTNKGQLQKEQGIKPGTPEWFKLWFENKHEN